MNKRRTGGEETREDLQRIINRRGTGVGDTRENPQRIINREEEQKEKTPEKIIKG